MSDEKHRFWKPHYYPGDLVWIEAADGRFYKGEIEKESLSWMYKETKRGKRLAEIRSTDIHHRRIGVPSIKYLVRTRDAKSIQPSSKGFQVLCSPGMLWPRREGDITPLAQMREALLKETYADLLASAIRRSLGEAKGDEKGQKPPVA